MCLKFSVSFQTYNYNGIVTVSVKGFQGSNFNINISIGGINRVGRYCAIGSSLYVLLRQYSSVAMGKL